MKEQKRIFRHLSLLIIIFIYGASLGFAQVQIPGRLDPTFGTDGIVITNAAISSGCWDVKVQSDGKIICAGYTSGSGVDRLFVVARYNLDGSLDSTFDDDGLAFIDFHQKGTVSSSFARSVNIQNDGKIVVVGTTFIGNLNHFAVARLNTDGSLDNSFDSDGKVVTLFGNSDSQAWSSAIHSDGKIVAAGFITNGSNRGFGIARYNSDGSLDTSLDNDGKISTPTIPGGAVAFGVAVQTDGKIVVGGYGQFQSEIVRFNTDGTFDTSFSDDGTAVLNLGAGSSRIQAVAIDNDGKILFAGIAIPPGRNFSTFTVGRLNTNGTLDSSFGNNGYVIPYMGNGTVHISSFARAIFIQPNGKIVVAGSAQPPGNDRFAIAKFNPDSSFDTSFNGDGKVFTPITEYALAYGIAMQPDGKLIIAGQRLIGPHFSFVLARYFNECSAENSCFNASVSGRVLTSENKPVRSAIIRAVRADGSTKHGFSNPFGYYRIKDLIVGDVYTFNVTAKGKTFQPITIKLTQENINSIDFIANP